MTDIQFKKYKMWLSFDNKVTKIEKSISEISNQCDGDSRQVGYNIENVAAMKKELHDVLSKYKTISVKAKENI